MISIHAPREGGDACCWHRASSAWEFQSTPPVRGATADLIAVHLHLVISIHAPREGGDLHQVGGLLHRGISIHAPREGGDYCDNILTHVKKISIHAPREGGDCRRWGPPAE